MQVNGRSAGRQWNGEFDNFSVIDGDIARCKLPTLIHQAIWLD